MISQINQLNLLYMFKYMKIKMLIQFYPMNNQSFSSININFDILEY